MPDLPALIWLLIAAVIASAVLGCLRVIGYEYYKAVLWHNLKIQVHNLRLEQKRRLESIESNRGGGGVVGTVGKASDVFVEEVA